MTLEHLEPRQLAKLGEGCACVASHSPATYVPADHHIVPQSWGGKTVPTNLVRLCPNAHTSVHRLLDTYVRAGGDPGWETLRHFSLFVRHLAAVAWANRPDHPTITSLTHG